MSTRNIFVVCCSLLFAIGVMAQSNTSSADSHFASEAAAGGMAEVKLGQLAQQNGSSDAVKQFGPRMEMDHSKAGEELKQVLQKDGMPVSPDLFRRSNAL